MKSKSWRGSALRDIRMVGPALMITFGLVLVLTPPASVGVAGSVGNAGVQFKEPPPTSEAPPTTQTPPVSESPPTTSAPSTTLPPESDDDGLDETVEQPQEPVEQADEGILADAVEQAPADRAASLPVTGGSDPAGGITVLGVAFLVVGGALFATGRRSRVTE
jgi:LPXTG-motif cell wall-anchored protein